MVKEHLPMLVNIIEHNKIALQLKDSYNYRLSDAGYSTYSH